MDIENLALVIITAFILILGTVLFSLEKIEEDNAAPYPNEASQGYANTYNIEPQAKENPIPIADSERYADDVWAYQARVEAARENTIRGK